MRSAEFRETLSPVMASPVLRRLVPAFAVSAIGDGMAAVGVAWLAIRIAAPADRDLVVGVAVAAYTLPGAAGAVLLARPLRALSGKHLVAADAALRAVTLSMIPLLYAFGALHAGAYVALLAASSLLHALIALADFEVSAADRVCKALDQAQDTAQPGSGELAGRLLDIIREYREA